MGKEEKRKKKEYRESHFFSLNESWCVCRKGNMKILENELEIARMFVEMLVELTWLRFIFILLDV